MIEFLYFTNILFESFINSYSKLHNNLNLSKNKFYTKEN